MFFVSRLIKVVLVIIWFLLFSPIRASVLGCNRGSVGTCLSTLCKKKKKKIVNPYFLLPDKATVTQLCVFSCIKKLILMDIPLPALSAFKHLHIRYSSHSFVFASALIWPALSERLLRRKKREGESETLCRTICSPDFPAHQLEEYESGCCSSPIDILITAVGRVTLRESATSAISTSDD